MSSLPPGTRVGPYEVLSPIGAGGMGEVFRARDTALHREVALKILPPGLANDPEYRTRFAREARILATLNHPHIAQVYGLEDSEAGPAIAMELVPGDSLRDRLRRNVGRQEALRLAHQIASALDVAHEQGIIHRDLKPGNVMVTPDGTAKVLDFGLAKTTADHEASTEHHTTLAATVQGAVVGTPAYMSPEQARGQAVDRRTDIWAFGCVLYELLAGKPAFTGESSSDLVVAILEHEPDWRALPADAPAHLRRLVRRCLEKDRRLRLRDIGDALPELSRPGNDQGDGAAAQPRSALSVATIAFIAAVFAMGALSAWLLLRGGRSGTSAGAGAPVRLALEPPVGARFGGGVPSVEATILSVSPDGSTVAFIATRPGEQPRIWVRPLGEETARELPSTDGAISVFWAPDGRTLGFFAGGQLKRLDISGGAPVKICDVPNNVGLSGSWGPQGDILFAAVQGNRVSRVSAAGGTPVDEIAESSGSGSGARLLWPKFLQDGRRFVYTVLTPDLQGRIMLAGPDGRGVPLVEATSQALWVDPDWLVFVREGTLLAQRVDLAAEKAVGEPVSIMGRVAYSAATGWSNVAASPTGTIVVQWHFDESRIAWFERGGAETGSVGSPGPYFALRLSPDDSTLLSTRLRPELGTYDIWATDLSRPSERRVTSSPGTENYPVWLPHSRAIVYAAARGGAPNLFYKDLTTGDERRLLSGLFQVPTDVSANGSQIIYNQRSELGNWDVMLVSVDDTSRVSPLFASPFSEIDGRLAQGGARMSLTSDESGRAQVYVSPFPVTGTKTAVSTATTGGHTARWRRDGRELYFRSRAGQLMAAPIDASGMPGTPRALFDAKAWLDYDVAKDGRFIAIVSQKVAGEQPLAVIVNWSPPGGRR